jgi:enolase
LKEKKLSTAVGDEGGFASKLKKNEEALEYLVKAIKKSGYSTSDVKIGLDVAASEFFNKGKYNLKINGKKQKINSKKLLNWYEKLVSKYPIYSIEDPFAEDDFLGFQKMKEKLGQKILIVGDDLTVTNVTRIQKAKEMNAINSVLIKLNQIGTLTETLKAIRQTQNNGWDAIISHRSGETSDTFISDLAAGTGAKLIKSGAPSRAERVCKYNRLLEIESEL